jgi:hypothetical protein
MSTPATAAAVAGNVPGPVSRALPDINDVLPIILKNIHVEYSEDIPDLHFTNFCKEFNTSGKEHVCNHLTSIMGNPNMEIFKTSDLLTAYGHLIFSILIPSGTKTFKMSPELINVVNCRDDFNTLTPDEISRFLPLSGDIPYLEHGRALLSNCLFYTIQTGVINFYLSPNYTPSFESFKADFDKISQLKLCFPTFGNPQSLHPEDGFVNLIFNCTTIKDSTDGCKILEHHTAIYYYSDSQHSAGCTDFELFEYDTETIKLGKNSWNVGQMRNMTKTRSSSELEERINDMQKKHMSLPEKFSRLFTRILTIGSTLVLAFPEPLSISMARSVVITDLATHVNSSLAITDFLEYFDIPSRPANVIIILPGHDISDRPIYRYFYWKNHKFIDQDPYISGGLALSFS